MNCRSVSPKTWEHARQALVFYFTRRHGLPNAEDLAHETLATILSREDYQFEKEEDFLRVCYGFAWHILQTARREAGRDISTSIEFTRTLSRPDTQGLRDAELNVYLNEVLRLGEDELRKPEWQLIQQSIVLDGDRIAADPVEANSARVKLHRARKKLVQLTGWRKR
jgi:DNA-directed RNA polymerase specialized sigma24 family protein